MGVVSRYFYYDQFCTFPSQMSHLTQSCSPRSDFAFLIQCHFASTMSATPYRPWVANVNHELNKLAFHQNPWNLPTSAASSRTRNGGGGRPNLARHLVNEESSVSSVDSSWSRHSSEETTTNNEEWVKKAPATRVIVEVDSTKAFFEKHCSCQECHGPVTISVRTTCLATNFMATCRDSSCGFVCYSESPAQVTLEEDADKRERSTN